MSENSDTDYIDLLNTCHRHTHCSTAYCLKKSQDGEQKGCFKFPLEKRTEIKLEFQLVHTKNKTECYSATIIT